MTFSKFIFVNDLKEFNDRNKTKHHQIVLQDK
jgi:hypothetical protein